MYGKMETEKKIEVIIMLRSECLASYLAHMECNGWDAYLSDPHVVIFKRDLQ